MGPKPRHGRLRDAEVGHLEKEGEAAQCGTCGSDWNDHPEMTARNMGHSLKVDVEETRA